ncbi:MAG: hypothetical protein Q4G46_12040, partial [Propionibacteriaceae bacterium]|nr:hypothetical protein [Propionibacteriaceae bacterium]
VLIDEQNLPMPRPIRQPLWKWLTLFTAGVTVVGCLAGMLWFLVVPLATYQIQADGQARVTERGLANFVAADAWFMIFGLVLGITVGIVVWSWFSGLGWQCVPLAIVASTVMGLLCWGVGTLLGPGPISGRLATAAPGDIVPIEFTLRATVGLVVWPFGAVLVLMLISALVPDPEDPGLEGRHATH